MPSVNARTIIKNALIEAGWHAVGETVSADDEGFGLDKLNRLVDQWQAARRYIHAVTFGLHTLQASLSPHTIGPSGTFVVAVRPARIESASLVLDTSPQVDAPQLVIRDKDWWAAQPVKGLSTSVPTDLYYSPDVPNGSLYFWPVPDTAYQVRLEYWTLLARFANAVTAYDFPPGYEEALTMTLGERLGGPLSASLAEQARHARSLIQGNNSKSPRVASADHGMPRTRRRTFNYYTGK